MLTYGNPIASCSIISAFLSTIIWGSYVCSGGAKSEQLRNTKRQKTVTTNTQANKNTLYYPKWEILESIWEREKTPHLYSPSGEKPKHSKAGVSKLFIKNPMCQPGNTPRQQREIFRPCTQTWLPSSACYVSTRGPQEDSLLAQEPTPHACSPHGLLPHCRSVCVSENRTAWNSIRQSRQFKFTKGLEIWPHSWRKLHCFEQNKRMQKPLCPTHPWLSGLASHFQQRISNIPEFTRGSESTRGHNFAQHACQEPQGGGLYLLVFLIAP